jgi:hypothetical protein
MSDVGVAPAPANEVPVNPDPVNIPTPVGPQAPDKPVDHKPENRNDSRRDAIQKAFARAEKAEPAKARMGHNQPPEPMERERTRPEKKDDRPGPIDLKKRPDDQPKQGEPRPRAEHGHFAARQAEKQTGQDSATQEQPLKGRHAALPQHAPYREPPSRMDDAAKADWHGTPETVRANFHRMHQEFTRAYQAYRADHDEMETIRHYSNMAREHGTSLQRALDNYTGMENKLRNDVVGGLDLIISNLNLQTPEGRRLGLEDVAWHIVNQTPEQRQLLQSKNRAMAQSHQLQQAQQRIAALENEYKQMQYAAQFHQTRAGVDQYAAAHPRVDELAELIANEVSLGFDLDTAYKRAELLRPATQAAQTRTNGTAAAQTRTHTAQTRNDRSIYGAPNGGPGDGSRRRGDKPVGRREAIANAMRYVNGM